MNVRNVTFLIIVKADYGDFGSGFEDRAVTVRIGDVIDARLRFEGVPARRFAALASADLLGLDLGHRRDGARAV